MAQDEKFLIENRVGYAKKILVLVGILLIGVTLALNNRIVAEILPVYRLSVMTELKVGLFVIDLLFVLAAVGVLVWQKSKTRMLLDVLVGLGFTLVLLAAVELVFYYFNSRDPLQVAVLTPIGESVGTDQIASGYTSSFFQPDAWLGYKLVPKARVVASRQNGADNLYEVIYTADEHGRRFTPTDRSQPAANPMLFFGGSFAFGEGVNDNETLPYYVSQFAPAYRGYNYGVGGYGPQQMLAKLQGEELTAEIQENGPRPVLVYVFIKQHIGRAIGSMSIHSQRGELMPYYQLNPDGTLSRKGTFVSARPGRSFLYNIAGNSQTLRFFGVNYPLTMSDRDFRTTARIIEESRDLFREKFGSDQFYVLIYPGMGIDEILSYFDAADINYLNYADLPAAQNDDFWLGEGHPTARAHRLVAEKLVEDLGLLAETEE